MKISINTNDTKLLYAINELKLFLNKYTNADILENNTTAEKQILLTVDGSNVKAGTPVIKDVVVKAKVVAHVQDKKITVFKYKPKKNERKKQGHRQPYTKITIESIG